MRVIGIAGYARAGKDEVGKCLRRRGYIVTRFSNELKKEILDRFPRLLTEVAKLEGYPSPELREVHEELVHVTKPAISRVLLQEYGTEVRRADDPEYWVNRWKAYVLGLGRPTCTVDVRFPNEAAAVRSLGGWIIRVERPGIGPLSDHVSERQDFPVDAVLANDGTLEDLDAAVGRCLERADSLRSRRPAPEHLAPVLRVEDRSTNVNEERDDRHHFGDLPDGGLLRA